MSDHSVPVLAIRGQKPEMDRFLEKVRVYARQELGRGHSEREIVKRLREKGAPFQVVFTVEREHLRLLNFSKPVEFVALVIAIAVGWYVKLQLPTTHHKVADPILQVVAAIITVLLVHWAIKQVWKLKKIPVTRAV